jgi:hypothetical protein
VSASRLIKALVVGALVMAFAVVLSAAAGSSAGPAVIQTPVSTPVVAWTPQTDNRATGTGKLLLDGSPVAGVRLSVDGYLLPGPTDPSGMFTYRVDDTVPGRHPITVSDVSHARRSGKPLTSSESGAVAGVTGAVTVAYPFADLKSGRAANGDPTLSGRIVAGAAGLPAVALYTYRLSGTVLDAQGHPVQGALVSTRTQDRDYWTLSGPTDAAGRFESLFTASSETGEDPVGMTLRVAVGDRVYSFLPAEYVWFRRLQSASVTIRLPPDGFASVLPLAQSYPGAVYRGVLVGASVAGRPIKPVAATWPASDGSFRITFPRADAGKTVKLWQGTFDVYSTTPATPGGPVDLGSWPTVIGPGVPQDLAEVQLP